jgi:tripartite-type tricarboxylate transporter receptor subunit TctC
LGTSAQVCRHIHLCVCSCRIQGMAQLGAMLRKQTVLLTLGAFVLGAHAGTTLAQRFASKPVTLVVGNAPGGGMDIVARLLAVRLTEILGQPVIVENRPAAAARVANQYVARAAADGYTLLVNTAAGVVDASALNRSAYEALSDFAPVSTIASSAMVLVVNAAVPVTDLRELLARARKMPGTLNYSSSGLGTTGHLYGELFKMRTGTDIVHVPYRGTAPALTALLAGDVDMSFVPVAGVLQYLRAGRLRALATTGDRRSVLVPDVPTMEEAGASGVAASVWYGLFAPAGTAPDVVDILARAVADASRSTGYRQRLLDLGVEPVASTPQEFAALLHEEAGRWTDVVKAAGIRAQ